jgi:DNA-binding IclR family transcriptional regulator
MTSPARALAVLDLFSRERPVWQPDEINAALGYTRATGYRYVKDLVEAGLLQKVSAGSYALGGRIIELDYQLRQSDPVLLAAIPTMERLAAATGYDTVLSVLFAGTKVVDIHRVNGRGSLALAYGRGRPRPLYRSGAPKVLLAGQPRALLLKQYQADAAIIAASGMGDSWPAFRAYLSGLRKAGFYCSTGELDPALGAAVVPVHNGEGSVVAALALVGTAQRVQAEPAPRLRAWLEQAAAELRQRLG